MRIFAATLLLLAGWLVTGCFSHKPAAAAPASGAGTMIITPDTSLAGKVVRYNDIGRYVVLSFPAGRLPKTGQSFFLYRNGLKVAEAKISNWQRDNYVVADLVTGLAQVGDDARDQ